MKRMNNDFRVVVNEKMLIVAIDIGFTEHWAYFRAPNGREVRPFSFCTLRSDFEELWRKIRTFQRESGLEGVVVGFESTGPYAEPLIHFLREKGVRLVQVNPMHTKRLKELTGNSPNKTDRKDPYVIADIIALQHGLSVVVPQGRAAELRRLTQARERAMTDMNGKINQLGQLVFVVFPEFYSIMKKTVSKSALFLLKHYPLPEALGAVKPATLAHQLRCISRGHFGRERACALIEAARRSVGITQGVAGITVEIRHLVDHIEQMRQYIAELETLMDECLQHIPCSQNLLSIRGVGVITIAGLIGEVGDFTSFRTFKELEKLAGLNLYEISSGAHEGRRHISKRGRPLMRKLLYCATLNTVRTNGIMYHPYHRLLDSGMPKMKAVVAIARKLLRLIYALVRDNTMFDGVHYSKTSLKNVA